MGLKGVLTVVGTYQLAATLRKTKTMALIERQEELLFDTRLLIELTALYHFERVLI